MDRLPNEAHDEELLHKVTLMWPRIVRTLLKMHPDAELAVLEDAASEALLRFAQKVRMIEHADEPFSWLLSTAEHRYQHERDKTKRLERLVKIDVEPSVIDETIEDFEANNYLDAILSRMPNDRYRMAFGFIQGGFEIKEIAEKMRISDAAAYKLTERVKKRVREIAIKSGFAPPPAIRMPAVLKIIQKNNGMECRIWMTKRDFILGGHRSFYRREPEK